MTNLRALLERCRDEAPTEDEAPLLFRASRDPSAARPIFAAAAEVREALLGREFMLCSEVTVRLPEWGA